ncbi:methyltransferase [Nonlabens sp. Asnod3-A02]|uniref:methyltransferase n=1 Tax=Nonlabens sp. Asnod3-A02 TaxID=3160579 RepID=UPI003867A2E9
MNWKDIELNEDQTGYSFNGQTLFEKQFLNALNFHKEGLAAVKDASGAYHIDMNGDSIYTQRYTRTFGYYYEKAAVLLKGKAFHIDMKGNRIYKEEYLWTGNYQQEICTVKDGSQNYYHINSKGERLYNDNYKYAGDFRENIACVQLYNNLFTHIYKDGSRVHNKLFKDLNVYHKGHACAKDNLGWCHIDLKGKPIYRERYLLLEPFYNGVALATDLSGEKVLVSE